MTSRVLLCRCVLYLLCYNRCPYVKMHNHVLYHDVKFPFSYHLKPYGRKTNQIDFDGIEPGPTYMVIEFYYVIASYLALLAALGAG